MTRHDADRLFATFARRGDPAALAQVFDLLAAELLLLAAHLAPPGVDAEDLLQGTFLRAIEQRARFDPSRPVRPWLVGILGNLAREARKQTARAPDAARAYTPIDAEPAAQAQTQELEGTVAQAVAALPRLDRQVLNLRLLHGLSDAQIAHALAVPLPTAKARLRRGLVRLRQALPASLARGMAVFAARGRDLKQLRAHVLAAAAAVTPAGTGAAAMAVKVAALLAIVLGGAAAYAWMTSSGGGDAGRVPATLAVEPAAASAGDREADTAAEPATAERAAVAGPVHGVRGRCVVRGSGAPIAGCAIEARLQQPFPATPDVAAAFARVRRPPVTAISAADGSFTFEPPPEITAFRLAITFAAPDCARAVLSLRQGDASRDLGDVALARPVPVFLAVRDTRRSPVAGAHVSFMPNLWQTPSSQVADSLQDCAGGGDRTDADGRVGVQLAPGTWLVSVNNHVLIAPTAIAVEETATRLEVEVEVLRRSAEEKLAGIVQDHAGQPLAGIWVSVDGETNAATTSERGAFTIQRHTGPTRPRSLHLRDFEGRAATTAVAGPFAWGRTDLVLTMPPVQSVRVRVCDAQSGQPLPQFTVHRTPVTNPGKPLPIAYPEPGVAVVPAVEWGVTTLRVLPEDAEHEPSAAILLERAEVADGELRVGLQRRGELHVRVRRGDGTPVAGSKVEVLVDPGEHLPMASLPILQLAGSAWSTMFAAQLDAATTGGDGVAVLRVAPAPEARALHVCGDHPEVVRRDIALQPGSPIEVTVAAPAMVRGMASPADLLADLRRASPPAQGNDPMAALMQVGLVFQPAEGTAAPWPTPIEADGRFAARGLPAGRCDILLNHCFRGGSHRTLLATVDLRAGEQDLALDLAPARPASLHAVVVAAGRPAVAACVYVHAYPGPSFTLYADAGGSFVVPSLPAGVYRVYLEENDRETGTALWIPSTEACDVRAGSTVNARFHCERRRARVRVVHTDGRAPVVDRCFQVTPGLPPPVCRTDGDGWLDLDPAPAGPFTLRAVVEGRQSCWTPVGAAIGPLEVSATEPTPVLTVCMPASK